MCSWVAADADAHQPFHMRVKAHALEHIALDVIPLYGSPRDFWCYGDEAWMGVIKSICARSKHPASLERMVLAKLRLWARTHRAE